MDAETLQKFVKAYEDETGIKDVELEQFTQAWSEGLLDQPNPMSSFNLEEVKRSLQIEIPYPKLWGLNQFACIMCFQSIFSAEPNVPSFKVMPMKEIVESWTVSMMSRMSQWFAVYICSGIILSRKSLSACIQLTMPIWQLMLSVVRESVGSLDDDIWAQIQKEPELVKFVLSQIELLKWFSFGDLLPIMDWMVSSKDETSKDETRDQTRIHQLWYSAMQELHKPGAQSFMFATDESVEIVQMFHDQLRREKIRAASGNVEIETISGGVSWAELKRIEEADKLNREQQEKRSSKQVHTGNVGSAVSTRMTTLYTEYQQPQTDNLNSIWASVSCIWKSVSSCFIKESISTQSSTDSSNQPQQKNSNQVMYEQHSGECSLFGCCFKPVASCLSSIINAIFKILTSKILMPLIVLITGFVIYSYLEDIKDLSFPYAKEYFGSIHEYPIFIQPLLSNLLTGFNELFSDQITNEYQGDINSKFNELQKKISIPELIFNKTGVSITQEIWQNSESNIFMNELNQTAYCSDTNYHKEVQKIIQHHNNDIPNSIKIGTDIPWADKYRCFNDTDYTQKLIGMTQFVQSVFIDDHNDTEAYQIVKDDLYYGYCSPALSNFVLEMHYPKLTLFRYQLGRRLCFHWYTGNFKGRPENEEDPDFRNVDTSLVKLLFDKYSEIETELSDKKIINKLTDIQKSFIKNEFAVMSNHLFRYYTLEKPDPNNGTKYYTNKEKKNKEIKDFFETRKTFIINEIQHAKTYRRDAIHPALLE